MPDDTNPMDDEPQDDAERAAALAAAEPQEKEPRGSGKAAISVTPKPGAMAVYGRGFEPNTTAQISVDGHPYAGQRVEPDGTFRRDVPVGKRVEFHGPDGLIAGADVS